MREEKNENKIDDKFFGRDEAVSDSIRPFLSHKNFTKIAEAEKKEIADVRARLAELYEPASGKIRKIGKEPGQKAGLQNLATPKQDETAESEKNEYAKTMAGKEESVLVPLSEIAKNSTYSKNYINFSARQGKLQAKKIGGVWHTTEAWLKSFTEISRANKNKFKEKLSHDLGGNKKFVFPKEEIESPRQIAKEKSNFAKKYIARNWNVARTWMQELGPPRLAEASRGGAGEMGDAKERMKLRGAKMVVFWKLSLAKPAAVMIALVFLIAVGNFTKADLGYFGDQGQKKMYFVYNAGVDALAKIAGRIDTGAEKNIANIKIGTDKFAKFAQNFFRREKIKEFENSSGLSLKGDESGKGEVAGVEGFGAQPAFGKAAASEGGKVLAATSTATGVRQMNVGDIEVAAYLMDSADKEIANGEYDVRFGIYTTDRTEADPYPSDADKGTRVWEETQKVTCENGLLKAYLGAINPIPANFNFAASNYYIGIRVGEDAEMVPRKRIGAVPLARTAMNATTVNGLIVGNAAGNIPTSNGNLNTNLNADLLDGKQASAFMPAGTTLIGNYDNYQSWKLQASANDSGQQIKTKKGAVFAGANGIITSRNLNTLTIAPTYGSTENTIAQGSTPLIVNTTGNLQGGGTGTAGGGIDLTLNTVASPTFTNLSLTNELRITNGNNFYAGFKAADTLAANQIWNLPSADGLPNQVMISDGAGNLGWATVGAAVGAPTNATYVTLGLNAGLDAERVLTGTTNQVIITDNGANGTIVLSLPQNIHAAATPTFGGMTLNGTLVLGANTLTTTNTNLISNLNADFLDGNHASAFQTALTNPVTGTGIAGYLTRWATGSTVGSSVIYDDGTNVGIGTTATGTYKLNVNGTLNASGALSALNFSGSSSGTNSGDQTLGGLGGVPTARSITINGTAYDLSADRTWNVGTVTAVSVASANGFAGTSSGGATPTLTLTTSVTGMIKGNGTALSAATAGTDYIAGGVGANHQVAYFSGSGTLAGSNSFWFDGTNVGIGTTDPWSMLDINGSWASIDLTDSNASGGSYINLMESANYFVELDYLNSGSNNANLLRIASSGVLETGNGSDGGLILLTQDASAPIRFATGGSSFSNERMRITPDGSVGIGTTDPGIYKLNINGSLIATGYYSSDGTAGASSTTGGLTFKNGLYTSGSISAGTNYWTAYGNDIASNNSGNVGIGTTSPGAKLSVYGDTYLNGSLTMGNTYGGKLSILSAGRNTSPIVVSDQNGARVWLSESVGGYYSFIMHDVNNSEGVYLNTGGFSYFNGGNVGIGTTNPLALLSVGATSQFQVNSSGVITAATGITSSGNISFSGLNPDGAELTGVLINGTNQLVTREFGTNAFSSTAFVDSAATAGYIPKMSDADSLANSVMYEAGGNIGIGTTDPSEKLNILGGNLKVEADYNNLGAESFNQPTFTPAHDKWQTWGNFSFIGDMLTYDASGGNQWSGLSQATGDMAIPNVAGAYRFEWTLQNVTAGDTQCYGPAGNAFTPANGTHHSDFFFSPANSDFYFGCEGTTGHFEVASVSLKEAPGGNGYFAGGTFGGINVNGNGYISGYAEIGNSLMIDKGGFDVWGGGSISATPGADGTILHIFDNGAATGSNTSFGGIYFRSDPGTDYVIGKMTVNDTGYFQIRTNTGSELLTINEAGSVGIGTTDPGIYKLNINGSLIATGYYSSDGTAGASSTTGGLTFKNGLYTSGSISAGTNYWTAYGNDIASNNSGNVGIGTTSPDRKLKVVDPNEVRIVANETAGGKSVELGVDATYAYVGTLSNHSFQIRTNDINRLAIDTSGLMTLSSGDSVDSRNLLISGTGAQGITINTTSSTGNAQAGINYENTSGYALTGLVATSGRILNTSVSGEFIFNNRVGPIVFSADSAFTRKDMYIATAGSVGIGTTDPGIYKLNINGSLIATGYYSSDGTAGASSTTGGLTFKNGLYTSGSISAGTNYWTAYGNDIANNNSGNVGIGTTSPTASLHVVGQNGNWDYDAPSVLTVVGGIGGASDTYNKGGSISLTGGLGGAMNDGGEGGSITLTGGNGGNAGMINGGKGGSLTFAGGNAGTASAGDGGAGGDLVLFGGNGTAGDPGLLFNDGRGGNIYLYGGATGGARASDGNVLLAVNQNGTSIGNVGIGTTSPEANLHIKNTSTSLEIEGTDPNGWSQLSIVNDLTSWSSMFGIGLLGSTNNTDGKPNEAYIQNYTPNGILTLGNQTHTSILIDTSHRVIFPSYNVGIGTTNPQSKLDVGGGTAGQTLTFSNTGNNSGSRLVAGVNFYTAAGYTGNLIQSYTGLGGWDNQYDLRFFTASGTASTEAMRIDQSGNVGIGTTNPGVKLEVYDSGWFASMRIHGGQQGIIQVGHDNAPSGTRNFNIQSFNGNLSFAQVNDAWSAVTATYLTVQGSSGNVGIGTTAPVAKLTIISPDTLTGPGFSLRQSNNNAYGYDFDTENVSTGRLDLYGVNNNVRSPLVSFMRGGNVGIGTNDPQMKLHVYSNTNGSQGFRVENNNTGSSAQAYFLITQNGITDHYIAEGTSTISDPGQAWDNAAYINVVAAAFNLGTYNAAPLNFRTNNTQRMTILSSGNVGIGTTNPEEKLSVGYGVNNDFAIGTATNNKLYFGTWNDFGAFTINRRVSDGNFAKTDRASAAIGLSSGNGSSFVYISTANANNSTDTEKMRIDGNGNVGIGTASPYYRLTVTKDSANNYIAFEENGGNAVYNKISTDSSHRLLFNTWNGAAFTNALALNNDGNVGIGTTNPTSLLTIGKIDNSYSAGLSSSATSELTINPSSNQPFGTYSSDPAGSVKYALQGFASVPASSTHNVNTIQGIDGEAWNTGTGTVNYLIGLGGFAYNLADTTVNVLHGSELSAESDIGTVGEMAAASVWSGVYGGSVTNEYGIWVSQDNGGGTVQNRYGIYIGANSGAATNDFGMYQASSAVKNYFSGNVGIGTTSPGGQLEVYGADYSSAIISSPLSTGFAGLFLHNDVGEAGFALGGSQWEGDNNVLNIYNGTGGSIDIGYSALRVTPSGNVGIGTTAPTAKLVIGNPINNTFPADTTFALASPNPRISLTSNDADPWWGSYIKGGYNNGSTLTLGTRNGVDTDVLTLEGSNVGIGTIAPEAKLEVVTSGDVTLSGFSQTQIGAILGSGVGRTITATTDIPQYSQIGMIGSGYYPEAAGLNSIGVVGLGDSGYLSAIGGLFKGKADYGLTTAYGVKAQATSFTGANGIGVYIDPGAGDGTNWGLYQEGTSDKNYFGGNVGIGTTAPGAKLDISFSNSASNQDLTGLNSQFTYSGALNDYNSHAVRGLASSPIANGTISNSSSLLVYGVNGNPIFSGSTSNGGESVIMYGFNAFPQFSGSIGGNNDTVNIYGFNASSTSNLGTTGNTEKYGGYFFVNGTADTNYGLYTYANGATKNYALYSALGTNYFGGNVGIGTTNPVEMLSIGTNSYFNVTSSGDVYANQQTLNGSSTTNGTGISATSLIVQNGGGANFDIGNYIKLDSTNCVSGVNTCYAKITAKSTDTLTISPALSWGNGATVTEVHIPELGGTGLAQTLNQRFGRGYFIDGIVAGNGTTYFTDSGMTSAKDYTFNGNQLTIQQSSGNVGIGTTNPTTKLHVFAPGQASTNVPVNVMTVEIGTKTSGTTDGYGPAIDFKDAGAVASDLGRIAAVYEHVASSYLGALAFYTNSSGAPVERVRISNAGNVGIGTTGPTNLLDVAGGVKIGAGYAGIGTTAPVNGLLIQGNVGIGTSNLGYALQVGTAGDGTEARANAWNSLSDVRLKNNFANVSDPLGKIESLTGYYYDWKNGSDHSRQFGVVAQDVEKVLPEIVSTDSLGYKSLDYGKLTPLLIEGVKAQQDMINDQATAISGLDLKVTENNTSVSDLQTAVNSKLNIVSNSLVAFDGRTGANEADLANIKSRLSDAEQKLQAGENNLATFQTATNDTLSAMLETENMLTEKVLDHSARLQTAEDRLKALEEKMAAVTITAGGEIPSNILTTDADGNVTLAGIFKSKKIETGGLVAGSMAVKNEKGSDAPTVGDGTILAVTADADKDGWDDVTKVDGKSVRITTKAVTETAKIFISCEGDPGSRYWVEKIIDPATGKMTDSFSINVSEAVKKDVKFSWWIIESR